MSTLDGDALGTEIVAALEAAGKISTKKTSWSIQVTAPTPTTTYEITVKDPGDLWSVEIEAVSGEDDDTAAEVGEVLLAALEANETTAGLLELSHDGSGELTLTGVSISVSFAVVVGAGLSTTQEPDVEDTASSTETEEIHQAIAGAIVDHVLAAKFVGAAPSGPSAPGQKGQMYYDGVNDYLYLCYSDGSWTRITGDTSF
jgi:hypothetical protein